MSTKEEQGRILTFDQKLSLALLVIAVATLALGLLAYLRPSDAAHPPHFDFFTHTVSLPIWLLIIIMIGIVGITVAIGLLKRQATEVVLLPQAHPVPILPRALLPQSQPGARVSHFPETTPITQGKTELTIESPDDILIHIRRYDSANIKGLTINADNNRLDPIARIAFTIYNAQSFDARHNDFRVGTAFTAAVINQPGIVQPCFSSNPTLFVRKDLNTTNLLASNDGSHPMIFPENDPSVVQKWRLSLGFIAHTAPLGATPTMPLRAIRHDVIVTWDRPANEFYVELANMVA